MESLVDKDPNSFGLEEILIYNNDCYSQIEEDFFDGWYWASLPNEVVHCGPECGPYSVGPFTSHMFTILYTNICHFLYILKQLPLNLKSICLPLCIISIQTNLSFWV